MEEFGFVNQIVEFDTEPKEQLEVVVEDIPNLIYDGMEMIFMISCLSLTQRLQSTWSWMI